MALSEALLDTLYAAPAAPALWGDVLDAYLAMAGADSGWVCELDRRDRFAGSGFVRNLEASTQERYFAHYAGLDPFRHDTAGAPDPGLGLWSDERFIAKHDLVQSEFYADFMQPIGVHSILIVRMFDDGQVTRSMHLNYRRGRTRSAGWRDLQASFAHLTRAAALSREIGRLASRGAGLGSALEVTTGCVLLLDRNGRICFATDAAEAELRHGDRLVAHGGRLGAARSADAVALEALVAHATCGAGRRSGGSTRMASRVRRDGDARVTVVPLGIEPSGRVDEPVAMVTMRDLTTSISAADRVMIEHVGLTCAERRVALMLVAGSSPRQIADKLAISYNTVRNHLKKIYEKFGVRRQSELVAVLLRHGLTGPGND